MRLEIEGDTSFALGMNDSAAADERQPGEATLLENCRITKTGNAARRRKGLRQMGFPASTNEVRAGIEYVTSAGTRYIIAIANTTAYYSTDYGATWTSLGSLGGAATARYTLLTMDEGGTRRCIILCATAAKQVTVTAMANISNLPSGAEFGTVMGNRLIVAGHDGSEVAASKVEDIDNGYGVTDGGWTVRAQTHENEGAITGLFTLGSAVLVFKRRSVGYIEGFGYQTLQVEVGSRGLTRSLGCVSAGSIQAIGDDGVMWLSDEGWVFYQVGGRPTLVSHGQQTLVDSLPMDLIESYPWLVCSLYYPAEREYWCAVPVGSQYVSAISARGPTVVYVFRPPSANAPAQSYRFHFGISESASERYTASLSAEGYLQLESHSGAQQATTFLPNDGYLKLTEAGEVGLEFVLSSGAFLGLASDNQAPSALWVANTGEREAPYVGGAGGSVYQAEDPYSDTDTAIGGYEIMMRVRTRPYTFGAQIVRKKAKRVEVQSAQGADATLTVYGVADGVFGAAHTLSFAGATHGRPSQQRARVGGRGYAHEVLLETTDDMEIAAVAMRAQLLEDEA